MGTELDIDDVSADWPLARRELKALRDHVQLLQAEVDRLRSSGPNGGTAWEPIATAPKDGTRILLAKIGESDGLPEFDVPPTPWSIRWATMGSWSSKYQKWWDGVEPCGLADPNYWMRLVPPKPPNAELSRDEPRSGEESA